MEDMDEFYSIPIMKPKGKKVCKRLLTTVRLFFSVTSTVLLFLIYENIHGVNRFFRKVVYIWFKCF